jgi:hypothetical protein
MNRSEPKRRKSSDEVFVPFMIYMPPKELKTLKSYAAKTGKSAGAILREGMRIRLNGDKDPYLLGYNDALNKSMSIIASCNEAKIVMPEGRSIEEIINDKLTDEYMEGQAYVKSVF